jgi:hypothetical protein
MMYDVGRASPAYPAPPWPFVPDDHEIARLDLAAENPFARLLLRLEDHRAPLEDQHLRVYARRLDDAAFRRQAAVEDRKAALGAVGVRKRPDDLGVFDAASFTFTSSGCPSR